MKSSNLQLVTEITLVLALVPALVGYYYNYKGRWIWSLFWYLLSVSILVTPAFIYIVFKSIQQCMPIIIRILARVSKRLTPVASFISHNKILRPLIVIFVRSQFFLWFMALLMSDQVIRIVLSRLAGQHATDRYLCKASRREKQQHNFVTNKFYINDSFDQCG